MHQLNHAMALWREGKREQAEQELLELLRVNPVNPRLLRALADVYAASGRAPAAIGLLRRLSQLAPADAGVLRQLGSLLIAQKAFAEAGEVLRAAIALEPLNARAHNNLGLAQLRGGDAVTAVLSLKQALVLDPTYALGHMNLGLAYRQQHLSTAAREALERALDIDPHLTDARLALSEIVRATDAASARKLDDQALESHATNLMTMRRHDEAIAIWSKLIDRNASLDFLEGMRFHCELHCCEWSRYEVMAARLEADALAGECSDLPFSFFVHSTSARAQLLCAQAYIAKKYPARQSRARHSPRVGAGRLRIAYLSFDFYEHATAYLITGLLERHDRSRFEVFAFSYGPNDDSAARRRLQASVDHFVDVRGRTDDEIADLLVEREIQIAIDLKGFTGGGRTGIFARQAAPLQINYLGYPGTMGANYVDYIIADRHLIPESDQVNYAERIIYLPQCYQPNDPRRPRPTVGPDRAHYGLPSQAFVFCCFNNLYKINPSVFSAWMTILRDVADSVLWLLEGPPAALRNLREAAERFGVAAERLVFAPHVGWEQHLARYRHADLFLDTSPCNAHTTASDSLWMGVPLVTLTGSTFAGRVATSLLHAVGLPQLCTATLEEYTERVRWLARTPRELAALKAHLDTGRMGFPLFNADAYTRHLEDAYLQILERECAEPSVPSASVPR